jgi:Zn-finger nucleic acid-binding protein
MPMQCPVCKDPQLVISERQGIEIDYCPACRGVWLDRGELDKLIEKSSQSAPSRQSSPTRQYDEHRSHEDSRSGYQKKPKSWLNEIFD